MAESNLDKDKVIAIAAVDAEVVLDGATKLTDALQGFTAKLGEVEPAIKKVRRLARWLVAVVMVVVLALGAIGALAIQVHHQTDVNTANAVTTCLHANITRADEITVFDHAIDLIAPPASLNASQLKSENTFKQYIDHVFTPHNCKAMKS
jgi:hypothetical protein